MEQTIGSRFAQRASSVGSDVPCPESAASPASSGWFGVRPSGADRAGQPRRARWFEVAAKNPMRGFCGTRTQPRSFRFSGPGVGSTFDVSSRTVRNPGVAKASARRRSRTGKRQEVHVAARRESVQLLARTDRGMPSSNRGRRATNGRWSTLQWGAVEGMNGVVMVGGFCVVVRITTPAAALFHHEARLRDLAGNCTLKAKGTAGALLDSVHTVDTGNDPSIRQKTTGPSAESPVWSKGTRVGIRLRRNRRP